MKKHITVFIISILAVFLVCGAVLAADKNSWFTRKDEGWFFYKTKPRPLKKEPKEERAPQAQAASPAESKPAHVKIDEHGKMLLGNAMVNPTEENVKTYMQYQKLMFDGADRFSKVWERVLAKNPELLMTQHTSDDVTIDIDKEIKVLSRKAGIFFFFQSDCPYCHKQAISITNLRDKYGFNVIAVSLDGGVIPSLQHITVADNGISERLGIQTVPAIYLAYPEEDKFEPISQGGYLQITDIERRLYQYAQLEMQDKNNNNYNLSDAVYNLMPR